MLDGLVFVFESDLFSFLDVLLSSLLHLFFYTSHMEEVKRLAHSN